MTDPTVTKLARALSSRPTERELLCELAHTLSPIGPVGAYPPCDLCGLPVPCVHGYAVVIWVGRDRRYVPGIYHGACCHAARIRAEIIEAISASLSELAAVERGTA